MRFLFLVFGLGCALMVSAVSPIDAALEDCRLRAGVEFREAPDEVFLRRAYLTVAGRLPTVEEAREFLRDRSVGKRGRLVDRLLDSEEFADLAAMRLADLLRIKSEFPINLWPNAVQAWHYRLAADIRADRSWRDMAYEMLTASGSNFRRPAANFFRASADRTPAGLAKAVAHTFLGINFEELTEAQQLAFAAFFSRVRYKGTDEWKEEIVYTDFEPATVTAAFPGADTFITMEAPAEDPRRRFADWLTADDNPYFASTMTNRVWFWIFGRSLLADPDWGGAPFDRGVAETLTKAFREGNYSLKTLYRTILHSRAFGAAAGEDEAALRCHAAYPVRRLEAELAVDALAQVTGRYDRYQSPIPEPFTFLPKETRAVTIADGSMSSSALDSFGRPPRDAGKLAERSNAVTEAQRLYLLNSGTLYRRLTELPGRMFRGRNVRSQERLDEIYLRILSRHPTAAERETFTRYLGNMKDRNRVWGDLAWILVNSKEFLYYH